MQNFVSALYQVAEVLSYLFNHSACMLVYVCVEIHDSHRVAYLAKMDDFRWENYAISVLWIQQRNAEEA